MIVVDDEDGSCSCMWYDDEVDDHEDFFALHFVRWDSSCIYSNFFARSSTKAFLIYLVPFLLP